MKTKVRIQQKSETYRHLYIQVLVNRYAKSDWLEVAGTITFQAGLSPKTIEGNLDSDFGVKYSVKEIEPWYALTYVVSTDKPSHLTYMAKLANYIKINSDYRLQPKELLQIIGAEEHILYNTDFLPKSWIGRYAYSAYNADKLYSTIYAKNDVLAEKELKRRIKNKRYPNENFSLKKDSEVVNRGQLITL